MSAPSILSPSPPPPLPSLSPDIATWLALLPLPFSAVSSQHVFAFLLSVFASMGTFVGGIVVIVLVKFAKTDTRSRRAARLIGVLQAFSAGVMLYMTFADLLPDSTKQLGSRETMSWFFCGITSFGVLERWIIPEHEEDEEAMFEELHDRSTQTKIKEPPATATCTGASSGDPRETDGVARPEGGPRKRSAARKPGQNGSASSNGAGDRSPDLNSAKGRRDLWRTSVITFAAMTLHNLPEGLGVYLSALADVKLGLQLAVAIMLHNIPEGMAVAIPLYVATDGSVARVLGMTLVNGLAEPVGVVVGGYLLMDFLSPTVLSRCLAGVAGIMACISLHELQPTAIKYCGKDLASFALLLGMFVCWVAMEGVEEIVGWH